MYVYDEFDQTLLDERVAEFSDQIKRRLSGELSEEEFRPLRLMNGTYLQLHAYMLRISIPYGTLSSKKMRMLAHVARTYDRGYGHFTTRQNIQFHWIKLEELPTRSADLAGVGLHGMQTSGNCVRNISTDQWAGVAPRRNRRPAPLCRDFAPAFDAAPRILVPAAQIQDRHHRRDARPRRGEDARYRAVAATQAEGRARFRSRGRRRPRAHALSRRDHPPVLPTSRIFWLMSRRSCASTTNTAGATISGRRASRSWCTISASRSSARRSRPNSPRRKTTRRCSTTRWSRKSPQRFRYPEYEKLEDNPAELQAAFRDANFRTLVLRTPWRRTGCRATPSSRCR